MVFSFNIPTLEHHCECTYMHTISVLLSYCFNWKLHSVVQEQSSDIAMVQASQTVQCPPSSCSTFSIRIFMYSVTSTGGLRQTLQMNVSHPKYVLLGGWSPSPLLSPSTLSPSQIQLIQHTASTCDNIHTVVPPPQKNKTKKTKQNKT